MISVRGRAFSCRDRPEPPVSFSLPADHLLWKKGMLSLMAGGTEEP
jgi:hypothetical protein